jgi:hypothetical protein
MTANALPELMIGDRAIGITGEHPAIILSTHPCGRMYSRPPRATDA